MCHIRRFRHLRYFRHPGIFVKIAMRPDITCRTYHSKYGYNYCQCALLLVSSTTARALYRFKHHNHSPIMQPYDMFRQCAIFSIMVLSVTCQSAQELINSVLNPAPGSEHYSSYSSEIYFNHTLYNTTPIASTNYDKLEASAKLRLPPSAYDYAAGGAGLEKTADANREAFDKVSLRGCSF